ncbi:ATP-dependent DNA helicase tlh2 [Ceratobasidium theobromae]|uniref:DNA 3'-5' helicase n=1 Tax=Ceratobasidium theobromae TaxID=1582974 RepID=A0A5N5Q902_9AGAM|nr:ATP-dependent DNA helicase tlh2 [Ceratobasidium theobromae]
MADVSIQQPKEVLVTASEPVGGKPWAKTMPELRAIKLCVLDYHNILCCLVCSDPPILLTATTAITHAMGHRSPGTRKPTRVQIENIISKFNVFRQPLHHVPTPPHPARPFPFLPEERAWRCMLCAQVGMDSIHRSDSSRQKHYQLVHPNFVRDRDEKLIHVQSFSGARDRNDFEVQPYIISPESIPPGIPLQPNTSPEELSLVLRAQWRPLPPVIGSLGDGYRETCPFLIRSGFAKYTQGWNEERLQSMLSLIEPPTDQEPLHKLYEMAQSIFKAQQEELWGLPDCHRVAVMQDDLDPKPLARLDTVQSQDTYGKCWALFLVFASYKKEWVDLILGVSHWIWRGGGEQDFRNLTQHKWSDPTLAKNHTIPWLKENLSICLSASQLCPFGVISELSTLASIYGDTTSKGPSVFWSDEDELTIASNTRVSIPRWKAGVEQYLVDVTRHWEKTIFFDIPLESIGLQLEPTTVIHDEHDCTRPGYSFLNDPRNGFLNLKFALADAIFVNPATASMHHGQQDGRILWDDAKVDEWLHALTVGVRELSNCVHTLCGLPPRGREETAWLIVNGVGRTRNFYLMGKGNVVCIDMYNKTSRMTGFDKPRAHCLPWCLGRIFLAMHILAIPFSSVLIEREGGTSARRIQETLAFPLRGVAPESEDVSQELERMFQLYVGAENMGLRNYRQFADATIEKFAPHLKDPVSSITSIADAQAGHSSRTAALHYGLESGRTRILLPQDYLQYRTVSLVWASLILKPEFFTDKEQEDIKCFTGRSSSTAPVSVSLPATNPTALADVIGHTIDYDELAKHIVKHQNQAPKPPSPSLPSVAPAPPEAIPIMTPAKYQGQIAPLVTKRHKEILRIFTGNKRSEWSCPGQAHAFVLATETGRRSLLAILPTGAGKSLLFMGMPLKETGLTIVVFPLRALLDDQLRTAERMGVRAMEWNSQDVDPLDGLIFLPVERVDRDFQRWCLAIKGQRRLNRIVLDEAHMVLETQDYRDAMKNMDLLVGAGVPLVILTATLPPCLEDELLKALGSPTVRVVREGTQRANISYHIAKYTSEDSATNALVSHVLLLKAQLQPGEGILISCRTYKAVETLANRIPGALIYTSREGNRLENAENWLAGRVPLLIATSGMGTGTHHSACRAVLHHGLPWGAHSYAQESGRAGRDGKAALAIMFHWGTDVQAPNLAVYNGWEALKTLAMTTDCIRAKMSSYLDGEDLQVSCYSGAYLECGNCLGQPSIEVAQHAKKNWGQDEIVVGSWTMDNEGMDIDATPQTHHAQIVEARQHAVQQAHAPGPAHPDVEDDARANIARRIAGDMQTIQSAAHGSLNWALLMAVMPWMSNRVQYKGVSTNIWMG